MLNFDTHRLSTGPNRTKADSMRWKCLLTTWLPKTVANRFVTDSSMAFRILKMNFPDSISSSAILCNVSKVTSVVRLFKDFSLVKCPMFVPSTCLIRVILWQTLFFLSLFFSPEATAYLTVFWLKVTPVPPWDLPTLSLSDMRESTCFTKIQPICPFAPPPPQTQAESRDTFKAAVGSDPILLHNNLTPDCNTLPLLWLAFIPRHIPAVGCWSRREYSLWFQLYNVASLHLDSETAAFHPQYFQFFLFPGPILRPQPPKTSSAKWNKFSLWMRFMLSETHCSIFSSQNSEFYKCFWSTYVKKIYTSCADRPCWSQIYWVALTPFKLLNLTRNFNISR